MLAKKVNAIAQKIVKTLTIELKPIFLRKILKDNRINKRVKRNYVILHGVLSTSGKTVQIHRNNLFEHGSDLKAFIKIRREKKKTVFVIGEFEFKLLSNGIIEITRTQKPHSYPIEFVRRWAFEFDVVKSILKGKKLYLILSLFKTISLYNTPVSVAKPFTDNT